MSFKCETCGYEAGDVFEVCPSCVGYTKQVSRTFINIPNVMALVCLLFISLLFVPLCEYSFKNFQKSDLMIELRMVEGKDATAEAEIYKKLLSFYPDNKRYKELLKEAEGRINSEK